MGELIVPVAMILMSMAFYYDAGKLDIYDDSLPMTSATYPQFLAVIISIASVFVIIRYFRKKKQFDEADRKQGFDLRVLLLFALFIVFYFVLPLLGYIPAGFLFLMVIALVFQKEKPRLLDTVVMPALLSVGLFYAFRMMSIYLPTGTLFRGLF